MEELVVVALAGFLASLVDGALGMGFGPTSTSILLGGGLTPVSTAATVNVAKVAAGAASGVAHWRLGNVDRRVVARLAVPGAAGAIIGTTILAVVDGDALRPALAVVLALAGLRILVRFSAPAMPAGAAKADGPGLAAAGLVGGVTNGLVGTWGPVVTPALLHRGLAPRLAVGSANAAEVAVAIVAVGSLASARGGSAVEPAPLVAMLVGGVLAAPVAARMVRRVPARPLGLAVAMLLLVTQAWQLATLGLVPVHPGVAALATAALVVAVAARSLIWAPRTRDRRSTRGSRRGTHPASDGPGSPTPSPSARPPANRSTAR